jgi:hypothetical protein
MATEAQVNANLLAQARYNHQEVLNMGAERSGRLASVTEVEKAA